LCTRGVNGYVGEPLKFIHKGKLIAMKVNRSDYVQEEVDDMKVNHSKSIHKGKLIAMKVNHSKCV
jgi:hypothetical protein